MGSGKINGHFYHYYLWITVAKVEPSVNVVLVQVIGKSNRSKNSVTRS